ncbi:HlyD family secretion protein [Halovulum sp. GXIMD14793]
MQKFKYLSIVVLVVAIAGGLIGYWRHETLYPSTQDAYIQAAVINIAPEVTGKVVAIHVSDNQRVSSGDPLFDLDDTVYKNALAQAKAQVEAAENARESFRQQISASAAAVESARVTLEATVAQGNRIKQLFDDDNASQAALDNARTTEASARSALHAAEASLARARSAAVSNEDTLVSARAAQNTAELNLDHTKITAPFDGWIANFSLREGTIVTAYTPLFAMVDNSEWWVEANFKETDLTRIKDGQPVAISVDLLPNVALTGIVESIRRGSGSTFALLPTENASGNWIKVTQRFTTRIALDESHPDLRVGASSTVTVDTTEQSQ